LNITLENIPEDHWSIKCPPEFKVAIVTLKPDGHKVLIKINPTDRRGYRLILQFMDEPMESTLNRRWTVKEMNSIWTMASIFMSILLRIKSHSSNLFCWKQFYGMDR
jgi:hypothetical protein